MLNTETDPITLPSDVTWLLALPTLWDHKKLFGYAAEGPANGKCSESVDSTTPAVTLAFRTTHAAQGFVGNQHLSGYYPEPCHEH